LPDISDDDEEEEEEEEEEEDDDDDEDDEEELWSDEEEEEGSWLARTKAPREEWAQQRGLDLEREEADLTPEQAYWLELYANCDQKIKDSKAPFAEKKKEWLAENLNFDEKALSQVSEKLEINMHASLSEERRDYNEKYREYEATVHNSEEACKRRLDQVIEASERARAGIIDSNKLVSFGYNPPGEGRGIITLGIGGCGIRTADHTLSRMEENLALEGTREGVFWRDRENGRREPRAVYVSHCPITGVVREGYRGQRACYGNDLVASGCESSLVGKGGLKEEALEQSVRRPRHVIASRAFRFTVTSEVRPAVVLGGTLSSR